MKKNLTFLFLLVFSIATAQNLQFAQWRFRNYQGADFKNLPPVPTSSQLGSTNPGGSYGSASVADDNGDLLFYTDGINVWDQNDQPLTNGNNLDGFNDFVASQRVIIVPKPGDPDRYYIFTIGAINHIASSGWVGRGGLHYSVVQKIAGIWQIPANLKNIPLKNMNGDLLDYPFDMNHVEDNPVFVSPETRMSSTLHHDGTKIWVALIVDFYFNHTHTRKFMNYLVSGSGINNLPDGTSPTPTVESPITPPSWQLEESTCMKFSTDGSKLCDVEEAVNLYPYDNLNGTVGTRTVLFDPGSSSPAMGWGADFSHDSHYLYYTLVAQGVFQDGKISGYGGNGGDGGGSRTKFGLYQYAIPDNGLEGGQTTFIYDPQEGIATDITPIPTDGYCYALQLARDNKIYVCLSGNGPIHLGVIDQPWVQGTGCNFLPHCTPEIPSGLYLPQWVHKVPNVIWPKVYDWGMKAVGGLIKDNSGNVFYSFYSNDVTNNINHNGAMVSSPNSYYTVQYNGLTGYTTWMKPDYYPGECLSNGDIRLTPTSIYPYNFSHFNSNSGLPVFNTTTLLSSEIVRLETVSGQYITFDVNTNSLWLHPTSGSRVAIPYDIRTFYYWPGTNKIYTHTAHWNGNGGQLYIDVYTISNTGLTLVSSVIQTVDFQFINIDNSETLYVMNNSTNSAFIERYINNVRTPVVIPNFNNSNLIYLPTPNNYPTDNILVYNKNDNKLYWLDLHNNTCKSMSTSNVESFSTGGVLGSYVIAGNDVFLSGNITDNQDITLGSQTITPVSPSSTNHFNSNFITKFNINTDFQYRANLESKQLTRSSTENSPAFSVTLFPNPSTNSLKIDIVEPNKIKGRVYTLFITNRFGNVLVKTERYIPGSTLNIGSFEKGIYFVEIVNDKGESVSKSLIKL